MLQQAQIKISPIRVMRFNSDLAKKYKISNMETLRSEKISSILETESRLDGTFGKYIEKWKNRFINTDTFTAIKEVTTNNSIFPIVIKNRVIPVGKITIGSIFTILLNRNTEDSVIYKMYYMGTSIDYLTIKREDSLKRFGNIIKNCESYINIMFSNTETQIERIVKNVKSLTLCIIDKINSYNTDTILAVNVFIEYTPHRSSDIWTTYDKPFIIQKSKKLRTVLHPIHTSGHHLMNWQENASTDF